MSSFLSLFSVPGFSTPDPSRTQSAGGDQSPAGRTSRDRIEQAFASASDTTGLPFDYFMTTAMRESSLDVDAAASTSSARGPFQFIEQTWLGMMHEHGASLGLENEASTIERTADGRFQVPNPEARDAVLAMRHDPELSAVMSGLYLQENAADIEAGLGRPITVGEGYVAHVFGPSGATRLISLAEQQPGRTAADVFPTQAAANQGLFYGHDGTAVTVGELYERLTAGFPNVAVHQAVSELAAMPRDGSPLSLTPEGFEALPTAPAYQPAGEDDLAARGLFAASGAGSTPFFAALYRPEGFGSREIAEDLVTTHGADQASRVRSAPNPVARPDDLRAHTGQNSQSDGAPLDLVQFSRTGELASLYRNPADGDGRSELVPPV